jgi:ankyrin repeat protein
MDEPYAKIDEEVLEIFEKAGVNLTAQDFEGQTLLHIVARKRTLRTYDRLMLLLSKGLDPMVRNAKGETAIDVAMSLEPSGESFYATILKNHVEGLNG